jgi:hypothetical protein
MIAWKPRGPSGPLRSLKQWTLFFLGIGVIMLLLFVVAPAAQEHMGIRDAVDEIRQRDIEAGAYYYTGVEQVRDAELFIRHSSEYPVESDRKGNIPVFQR